MEKICELGMDSSIDFGPKASSGDTKPIRKQMKRERERTKALNAPKIKEAKSNGRHVHNMATKENKKPKMKETTQQRKSFEEVGCARRSARCVVAARCL